MVGVLEMTTVTGVCLDIETGLNVAEACLDMVLVEVGLDMVEVGLDMVTEVGLVISRHFTGPFFSKAPTWVIFFQTPGSFGKK